VRRVLGVVAFAVAATGFFVAPAGAQNETVITIPLDTSVFGAPGSEHLLGTVAVPADDVGRECGVAAEGMNNESVHPDTDLIVRSGDGELVVPDVERAPNVRTEATGTFTLGTEVSVLVQLGPDGIFSGGVVVTVECVPVPPPSGQGLCEESVNPHGETTPPAGSSTLPGAQGGQNEDGFYRISSTTGVEVFVVDTGSGTVFGPYPSGTVVKYTEANGATPNEKTIGSTNGQAGAVLVHITGTGDMGVRTSTSGITVCLVPPPPK
jgi:hypothetical protein